MRLFLIFLFCFLVTAPALAAKDRVFTVNFENDKFLSGTDQNFTNGVRFTVDFGEKSQPKFIKGFFDALPLLPKTYDERILSLAVGQNMYTPQDISTPALVTGDRPYGGWLYVEAGAQVRKGDHRDIFSLQLGVTGPASGAGAVQRWYHNIRNVAIPQGWSNQIRTEPGIVLSYARVWDFLETIGNTDWGFSISPHVAGVVGNIFTHGAGGVSLRFGKGLDADNGPPPRIAPAAPSSSYFGEAEKFAIYVFASAEGRAVARNIFLDGNTFTTSHSVAKKHILGQFQVGLVIIAKTGWRLSYAQTWQTREFVIQPKRHSYGTMTLSALF